MYLPNFQVCPDHYGGENCQECERGYAKDPATGRCMATGPRECPCDAAGSISAEYLSGKYQTEA